MRIMILYLELELLAKGAAVRGRANTRIVRGETTTANRHLTSNQSLPLVFK